MSERGDLRERSTQQTAPRPLTARQAEVLRKVQEIYAVTGEGCSASLIARRLDIRNHEAVRGHFAALYRKGWLLSSHCPAVPRFLDRRP